MAGDLSFFLAVDSAETIRTASKDDLKRWGVDEETAWARAAANIKSRVGPLAQVRLSNENGVSGFTADSGLAPSVLADPSSCGPKTPNGVAGQVVLVLARDTFLYAPAEDRELMISFWDAVERETAAGRSLSNTPITCRAGKWVSAQKP